ncbi:S-layer homology domain-containing protein [Anaerotignum sp.]|uniref:S-layer homology domain-containing protein n=1 Tax=Anaerotignum sp. TaxID=2039241 RepID=UPI0028A8FEDC|nr:S-layer homology domain-containing protein [Anaerotignum sp.]
MKRKMALALAAVMASSCMSVTGYAANFKDINDVPWDGAKTVINSVADLGLLNGYEDNTFRAKNNVTYCEAIHMLYTALDKSGAAKPIDAVTQNKYAPFMQGLNIPAWAQRSVAYGLENNIITTTDLAKFMTGSKSNLATRSDVAKMFGNALAVRYDIDKEAKAANKFGDAWHIPSDSIILVDLLARLGIVNGDNYNNFNPAKNINRAEMAVMLNKTFETLKSGVGNTGVISEFEYDGSTYKMKIKTDIGDILSFYAVPGLVKVYDGDTTKELPLSRLNPGDKIGFVYNGGSLDSIRILDGSTVKEKYDITGYITAVKSGEISLENENTGLTQKLNIDGDCLFYLDNKSVKRSTLEQELKDNYNKYAYAGINTRTTLEKGKDGSGHTTQIEKTYVTEVYVTFSDEYSRTGIVDNMESNYIVYKPTDSSERNTIYFASNCDYYIDDSSVSVSKVKDLANSGTIYVRITINKEGKASKIVVSEKSFVDEKNDTKTIYQVKDFTESQMILEAGGSKLTYKFGSTNPTSNITFYQWDEDDGDWITSKVSNAESYFDSNDRKDKTVYSRVEFNSGGKLNKVYLSTKKSAWSSTSSDSFSERKAEVESLSGNALKFKNSSVSYTLLNQYNQKIDAGKDTDTITGTVDGYGLVKNPLTIWGAKTNSLTNFKKMAEAKNVTLYAEIKADGNNVIQSIEARLTAATGKLVSYDADDKELVLETSDGQKLTLTTTRKPSTGTDDYTYEDIATAGYIGSSVTLGFNNDGVIDKIKVTESTVNKGTIRVKGVAEYDEGGLKFKNNSTVYGWLGRSNTEVHNYSMDSTSLDRLKEAIADRDVTIYAEAGLNDKNKVERINVYYQEAEGAFQEYDEDNKTIRILTDAGNKYTFNLATKPNIDIKGIALNKLNDTAVGKNIELTFDSDGLLKSVKG